ncbi:MAG TPA: spore germination protein [Symbiobacteriaceae bacterium]|nr:spore germination protein [Symbiobacteriaceae bacterium]
MAERSQSLSAQLDTNLSELQTWFGDTHDLAVRPVRLGEASQQRAAVAYLFGTVDQTALAEQVLEPLARAGQFSAVPDGGPIPNMAVIREQVLSAGISQSVTEWSELSREMPGGAAALFVDGLAEALLIYLRVELFRSIAEPPTSPVVRGSREGLIESLDANLAMVRRRIRSPKLHTAMITIGDLTRTKVAVLHIRGIADPAIVAEVMARLRRIRIEGVLESGYLEEFIQDQSFTLFPTIRNTERVDVVTGSLMEGRVAIITDGTPFALIVPISFNGLLQVSEDYNQHFPLATFVRWVRYLATTLALTLTGLYVAIVSFNQEILPFGLALRLAASRLGLPLPTIVEALALEGAFEILREAGLRMPRAIGQAISIVGVLVLGEAAVRAGIVDPIMIIVVGAGALSSFAIPDYALVSAFRVTRLGIIILSGTFGLFGLMWGVLFVVTHLLSLKSFGLAYLSPMAPFRPEPLLRDAWSRALWSSNLWRPGFARKRRRQPEKNLPGVGRPDPEGGNRR